MFGIGTTEIIIILVVALLVIGPTKLPEVAKSLGKGMAEFKRMSSDVKNTIDWETQIKEEKNSNSEDASTEKSSPGIGSEVPAPEEEMEQGPLEEANLQKQSKRAENTVAEAENPEQDIYEKRVNSKEQDKDER